MICAADMPRAALLAAIEKAGRRYSVACDAVIAEGGGALTHADMRRQATDGTASAAVLALLAAWDAESVLRDEASRRMRWQGTHRRIVVRP